MRGIASGLRVRITALAHRRLDLVSRFVSMRGGRHAEALQAICAEWACRDAAINARWPDEAQAASRTRLYEYASCYREGDVAFLLGRIQPRLSQRKSRRLASSEPELKRVLGSLVFNLPMTTPVTVLHAALARRAKEAGLPVPAEKWTRRTADDLRADSMFATLSHKGAKGMLLGGPYIHVDKTAIKPGAQYVVDNRQFDCEVICSDGELRRPWITRVVDHRTLLPVGWSILESAANGDSVMATLAAAMMPKVRNPWNAVAGEALGIICGVPDDCWIFDHGKDFGDKRVIGMEVKRLAIQAHQSVGDGRPANEIVLGLLAETEARVRRAIPYNAKAKIVERSFRDDSRGFDVLVPGYVGSKPDERPARTEEMRRKFAKLAKAQCTRKEVAEATGYLLIEDFAARYEAWSWSWASREDSRAQGLQHDGRAWSPLALWGKLAPSRRIPSAAMLERLSMVPSKRRVNRGTVTINHRVYWSDELLELSGREVVVRWSRMNPRFVLIEQVVGEGPLPVPLRVLEVERVSATASEEELRAAMDRVQRARRGERARIEDMTSAAFGDPLVDLAAEVARQGRESGRGQIISINGQSVTPIISVRDEVVARGGGVEVEASRDVFGLDRPEEQFATWRFQSGVGG